MHTIKHYVDVVRAVMAHDGVFLIFVMGTLIIMMFACSLILFVVQYKRKQQLHAVETEHLEQQYTSLLLQTRLEVQEQSLKYLSEEIHDNIGQVLTLVKLNLYELGQYVKEEEPAAIVEQGYTFLGKAISDLRSISHRLNGDFVTNEGLEKMLRKELEYLNMSKAIAATLSVTGDPVTLTAGSELLIFRIMQEAIANVVKHASSKNVRVILDYTDGVFTATIHDDGKGFDEQAMGDAGLGLMNMRSRAALLDGTLDITSRKDKGTIVQLKISITNDNRERDY